MWRKRMGAAWDAAPQGGRNGFHQWHTGAGGWRVLQVSARGLLSAGAHMRRRDFITAFAGAAMAWPLGARAQQSTAPVVGVLSSGSADAFAPRVRAFRQGLQETGYTEGRNVAIELRWADGRYERLPALAAELVKRQVAVIATIGGTPAAAAAKAATTTIPVVFQMGADPVEVGVVASLGRPGGNVTGVTSLGVELAPKQLELLRELVPAAGIAALLVNPTSPIAEPVARSAQAAARTLALQLHVLQARTERDFEAAFAAIAELRAGGLVITTDDFFQQSRRTAQYPQPEAWSADDRQLPRARRQRLAR